MAMPKLTEPYAQTRKTTTTHSPCWRSRLGFRRTHSPRAAVPGNGCAPPLRDMVDNIGFRGAARSTSSGAPAGCRLPTEDGLTLLADFRADPSTHRLGTPSGLIEIFSADIDGFGYDDCAGHPDWFEPTEWLGGPRAARYPLHLLANQPASRLHSQLDGGAASQKSKVAGREPIRMHPRMPQARGLAGRRRGPGVQRSGRVPGRGGARRRSPSSGSCSCRPGHGSIPPIQPTRIAMCVHGNPNVLTDDVGTSSLAQWLHRRACPGGGGEVHRRATAACAPISRR